MPAKKILVVFAHPLLERSNVNKELIKAYDPSRVEWVDLYEKYPEFLFPIAYEKELIEAHDVICLHHPLYWFSSPPLLKQWLDVVFEVGWAFGPGGNALRGKKLIQIVTTGGSAHAYTTEGANGAPIQDFLKPFEQTARVCQMDYLPPFVVHATHRLSLQDILGYRADLQNLMEKLQDPAFLAQEFSPYTTMNDYL
ncbi:MAG: NAD(P)H-dependent oxidoreductase [Spirosomataceae bacterium]